MTTANELSNSEKADLFREISGGRPDSVRTESFSDEAHSSRHGSITARRRPLRMGSDGKMLLSLSWFLVFVFGAGFIAASLAWRGTVHEKEKLHDDVRSTVRGFIGAAEAQIATGNFSEAADIIEGLAEINAAMPGDDVSDEINGDLITARRIELTERLLLSCHFDSDRVGRAMAILTEANTGD